MARSPPSLTVEFLQPDCDALRWLRGRLRAHLDSAEAGGSQFSAHALRSLLTALAQTPARVTLSRRLRRTVVGRELWSRRRDIAMAPQFRLACEPEARRARAVRRRGREPGCRARQPLPEPRVEALNEKRRGRP